MFRRIVRSAVTIGAATWLVFFGGGLPAYALDESSGCTPVVASSGVQRPNGSDSGTYTYNECTGLWENPHYTWNPNTKVTTPLDPAVYTYNAATGKWDVKQWSYSPASKSWYQSTSSVSQPPAGSQTVGGPAPAPTQTPSTSSGAGTEKPDSQQAPKTTNQTTNTSTNTSTLGNTITSNATSGNVQQVGNTKAGNATSGNAQAIANVMNLLQSSSSMGSPVATFAVTIDGDVQGDLVIDANMLQSSLANENLMNTGNVDINVANNGSIANTITLDATSGDVTSSKNTTAGNATSGNAQAMANVVNMMNSMITANQSFMGVLSINGSLNGNILMPENFLDTLIATNAPHETIQVSQDAISNAATSITNNQTITNTVNSKATSGTVTSAQNTISGNATSGAASTDVTIFDLTNSQITAANAVLVFVNVQGTWVGVIMNSPVGATAALLGGAVRNNSTVDRSTISATNTGSISNVINVSATSGDVASTKNTRTGDATSGDANTSVNIANITNSSLSLGQWFGVLFINILGDWNGSFGVLQPQQSSTGGKGAAAESGGGVFTFAPAAGGSSGASSSSAGKAKTTTAYSGSSSTGSYGQAQSNRAANFTAIPTSAILGAATTANHAGAGNASRSTGSEGDSQVQLFIVAGILLGIGGGIMGLDMIQKRRSTM